MITGRRRAACSSGPSPRSTTTGTVTEDGATGTASGQPSISSTSTAPDHCSCSGERCSAGKAQSQGSTTSVASSGVSSAVKASFTKCPAVTATSVAVVAVRRSGRDTRET